MTALIGISPVCGNLFGASFSSPEFILPVFLVLLSSFNTALFELLFVLVFFVLFVALFVVLFGKLFVFVGTSVLLFTAFGVVGLLFVLLLFAFAVF